MLVKNFDHSKTYYKVLNTGENHNKFQFKDGLNIFDRDFDDVYGSASDGGLYFTSLKYLIQFFKDGDHIREIKIPEDAMIVKTEETWRTNKMILGKRISKDEYFDTLWNSDTFNWRDSYYLSKHVVDYFDRWWNPEKFEWRNSDYLAKFCSKNFDRWWNPEKFHWLHARDLAKYCSDKFNIWWDPDRYDWDDENYLAMYCSEYRDIWSKDVRSKFKL